MSEAPENFLCPLTLQVMKEPVKHVRTGHTYEKSAILEWLFLHGKATCPLTRQPLHPSQLTEDEELGRRIRAWKEEMKIDKKLAMITAFCCGPEEDSKRYYRSTCLHCTTRKPKISGNIRAKEITC